MFGVNFDHLIEGRLTRIDPDWHSSPSGSFLVPKKLQHLNGRANHDWHSVGTANLMFSQLQLPAVTGSSDVALLESGDCWCHNRGANPWHFLRSILNWHILGTLLGSTFEQTAMFLLTGMDEFWKERKSGFTAYSSLAKIVVDRYHDDDHNMVNSLRSADVRVALQGVVPIALTGVPSGASSLWSPEKAYSKLGDCSKLHQELAIGGCTVRSEVVAGLRVRLLKQLARTNSSDTIFPVYDALDRFGDNIKLVLPKHMRSSVSDNRTILNQ